MQIKIIRRFVFSVGVILLVTSIAKIVSASGQAAVLKMTDPIFGLPFQSLLWTIGGVEFTVALACFLWKNINIQAMLIAWLASSFLVYRIALVWIGYGKPCSCLGNLTDALHIPPQTADMAMKIILAYMLIGSYATLFWLCRQNRKVEGGMKNEEFKGISEIGVGS